MFIVFIIGCTLILDGSKAIYRYFNLNTQWKESQAWPSTPGKIIRSKVKGVRVASFSRHRSADGGRTAFMPDIMYLYCTNGESFESGQLFLGQSTVGNFDYASDLIGQYPEGSEVTVYYNPEEPETALLDRNKDTEISSKLFSGMIFVMIGLVMLIVSLGGMIAG
jgi:hypothetical protein